MESSKVALPRDGEMLSQCAEAKIYAVDFDGTAAICKHRFEKHYRHPQLDRKLREQRTAREARALERCRKHGIRTPAVYAVDKATSRIYMERIAGRTVKEILDEEKQQLPCAGRQADTKDATAQTRVTASPRTLRLLRGIGELVGLMHNADIIHGDLTTSNFMLIEGEKEGPHESSAGVGGRGGAPVDACARDGLVVIDFGLVAEKHNPEERAVDLYVLERAIIATHSFVESYASAVILDGYNATVEAKKGAATMARLKVVRARGRKRSMVG